MFDFGEMKADIEREGFVDDDMCRTSFKVGLPEMGGSQRHNNDGLILRSKKYSGPS